MRDDTTLREDPDFDPYDEAKKRRLKREEKEAQRLRDGFAMMASSGEGEIDEDTDPNDDD